VARCRDDDHLLVANDAGFVTRFAADEVRPMGRTAAGVAGMNVPAAAEVVALSVVPAGSDDGEVLTVAGDGTAKRSPLADYPVKGRGGKGLSPAADALLWCGTRRDLHVGGDDPTVVRAVDLPEAKRAGRGLPSTSSPTGRSSPSSRGHPGRLTGRRPRTADRRRT
jgi:DNA gyrase subunit A